MRFKPRKKQIIIHYRNADVMYILPDDVFEVCYRIYYTYRIMLRQNVSFVDIYDDLPDELRHGINIVEGKRKEFVKRVAEIREFVDENRRTVN